MHLLGLAGIATSPKGRYFERPIRTGINVTFYWLATTGLVIWLVYVFARAPGFGPNPECNHERIFVVMGVSIRATNGFFRAFAITLAITVSLGFITWANYSAVKRLRGRSLTAESNKRQNHRKLNHSLVRLIGIGYMNAMLEVIIRRNALQPGVNSVWSFGQILAMAMLMGPAIELLALFLRNINPIDISLLHRRDQMTGEVAGLWASMVKRTTLNLRKLIHALQRRDGQTKTLAIKINHLQATEGRRSAEV